VKSFIPATLLICLAGISLAQDTAERVWTGSNGKSFRGRFHKLSEDGQKAEFLSSDGKLLAVALGNLIPADRERLLNPVKPSVAPAAAGSSTDFKPAASPDRSMTPLLDPKSFGGSTDESLVDAVWISMLWWDRTGVLEVPKKGEFESKAEWLHKKLTRAMDTGNDSMSADDAKTGVAKYFSEELKELADCRASVKTLDFSATRLAGMLQGSNAVVMRMSMQYANGRDYAVSAVLVSMSPEGKFVIHLFGKRFAGRIKPMEGSKPGPPGSVPSEYVLDQPEDLPDYYAKNEARFFMGEKSWNATLVLKPYVYLTPGKPAPLPPEEPVVPAAGAPVPVVVAGSTGERVLAPKFPIHFATPVDGRREWVLSDGRKIRGIVTGRGVSQVSLKGDDGQQATVEAGLLSEEDRARVVFWDASRGTPLSIPKLDLTYQFVTPMNGTIGVNVASEGTTGRVCYTKENSTWTLVYDMKDEAFVSTMVHRGKDKETTRVRMGRFLKVLPREIETRHTQEEVDRFVTGTLPRSPESESAVVPCRRMRFPLWGGGITFRNSEIDFVLCEQPVVAAGLYRLFFSQTAGGEGEKYHVFSPAEVPIADGGESLFPMLAASRMLPLRIVWENARNERITEEYHRVRNAGKFSLELTRAVIPAAFPESHFAIPPAARAMAAGTSISKETTRGL